VLQSRITELENEISALKRSSGERGSGNNQRSGSFGNVSPTSTRGGVKRQEDQRIGDSSEERSGSDDEMDIYSEGRNHGGMQDEDSSVAASATREDPRSITASVSSWYVLRDSAKLPVCSGQRLLTCGQFLGRLIRRIIIRASTKPRATAVRSRKCYGSTVIWLI